MLVFIRYFSVYIRYFIFTGTKSDLTPASADVKRGAFFCFAKNVTLFTVSWMHWLGFKIVITYIIYSCLHYFPITAIYKKGLQ